MLLFQSEDSPIGMLSSSQISLIVSILCVGGCLGTVVFGFLCDVLGRKLSMLMAAIPQIAANVFLIIGTDFYFICAARLLFGFAAGGVFIIVPIFVSEISHER